VVPLSCSYTIHRRCDACHKPLGCRMTIDLNVDKFKQSPTLSVSSVAVCINYTADLHHTMAFSYLAYQQLHKSVHCWQCHSKNKGTVFEIVCEIVVLYGKHFDENVAREIFACIAVFMCNEVSLSCRLEWGSDWWPSGRRLDYLPDWAEEQVPQHVSFRSDCVLLRLLRFWVASLFDINSMYLITS